MIGSWQKISVVFILIFVRFLCKECATISQETCADIAGYNNCAFFVYSCVVMGAAQYFYDEFHKKKFTMYVSLRRWCLHAKL